MDGASEQIGGGGQFEQAAAVHDAYAITNLRDNAKVMSDEHDCRTMFAPKRVDQPQHLRLNRNVKSCRGFVGDQEGRVVGERGGDDDALALPAGQTMRRIM